MLDLLGSRDSSLHTAAAPAEQAADKTTLSYRNETRNDTIITFLIAANKNIEIAKVALASSDS